MAGTWRVAGGGRPGGLAPQSAAREPPPCLPSPLPPPPLQSPYTLTFLTTDPQGPEDTAMLGGTFFGHPELGLPFVNDTSCDVESPWPGQGSAEIDPELCLVRGAGSGRGL